MDRVTEDDLLALIEGELPEGRRAIVEAALRADPALVERVRRMKADREGLAELARDDVAPGGLVEGAMARAERTRLVQVDTGGPVHAPSLARGSRGRRMQMAVAAVLVIGALGVWVWLMAIVSSSEKLATHERRLPPIAQVDAEGKLKTESAAKAAQVGPEAPKGLEVTGPSVAQAQHRIAAPDREEKADDALLAEWLENLGSAADSGYGGQAMDWRHAARLALAGRLRIEVAGSGPIAVALAASSEGGAPHREYQVMRRGSGVDEGWRVELSFGAPDAEAELAGALEAAIGELHARMGRRVWVSESPTVDEEGVPAPASDIGSVLWWGEGPEAWTRRMSVRVPVVFAGE